MAGSDERGQYDDTGTRPPGRLRYLAYGLVPVNVRAHEASRTPSIRSLAVAGSGAGLVGGACGWGSGDASTVRPDPSTSGAVGERGSHHESGLQLGSGCCVGRWLPGGEEQVAVKAEEVPSLASDLVEIGQPGVGLLPGELATSDGEVSHDFAVGDAVGVGTVVGIEQHQHLRLVDREANSTKLAGQRAGEVRVGEPLGPGGQESSHSVGVGGVPDDRVPVGVKDQCPTAGP